MLALKKHIRTLVGIVVFAHLLLYSSKPASGNVFNSDITGSFALSNAAFHHNAGPAKAIARIKFPSERRKYGLNESNTALISFTETRVHYNTDKASVIRSHQQKISSSCFSLALLRAPPLA